MSLQGMASVFGVWDDSGHFFAGSVDRSSNSFVVYGPIVDERDSPPPFVAWARFHSDEVGDGVDRMEKLLSRPDAADAVLKKMGWVPDHFRVIVPKLLGSIRHFYSTPVEQIVATPETRRPLAEVLAQDPGLAAGVERFKKSKS